MAPHVYPNDPNPRSVYFDDGFAYKDALPEWSIQGLSLYNNNKEENVAGGVDDAQTFTVKVKVKREHSYYLHKMVMVLLMLSIFTGAVAMINPIYEFADRLSYVMTVFLAIVAFAFVISSSTPSMPYLTVLDKLTSASYAVTFFVGLETLAIALLAEGLEDHFEDDLLLYDRMAVAAMVGLSVIYYLIQVGSRISLNKDAPRKALDIAVEPQFLKKVGTSEDGVIAVKQGVELVTKPPLN